MNCNRATGDDVLEGFVCSCVMVGSMACACFLHCWVVYRDKQ